MSRNPESLVTKSLKVGLGAFLGLTSIQAAFKSPTVEKAASRAAYVQQANPKNFDNLVSDIEGLKGLHWQKGTGYMSTWIKAESNLKDNDEVVISIRSTKPFSGELPEPNKVTDINISRFIKGTEISPIMNPAKSPVPEVTETFTPNIPEFGNTAKNTLNSWALYNEISKPTYYFPPDPNSSYTVDVNGDLVITQKGEAKEKILRSKTEANIVMNGIQNQFYAIAEAANYHTNVQTSPIEVK